MPLRKARVTKPDGRHLWYYAWDRPLPEVLKHNLKHEAHMLVCRAADGLRFHEAST